MPRDGAITFGELVGQVGPPSIQGPWAGDGGGDRARRPDEDMGSRQADRTRAPPPPALWLARGISSSPRQGHPFRAGGPSQRRRPRSLVRARALACFCRLSDDRRGARQVGSVTCHGDRLPLMQRAITISITKIAKIVMGARLGRTG